MSLFQKLMKSKGLLGGKYSKGLDEELVNDMLDSFDTEEETVQTHEESSTTDRMKRRVEEVEDDEEKNDEPSSSTPAKPVSVGGVITSPGVGFLRVQEEVEDIDEQETVDAPLEPLPKVAKKAKKTAAEYLAREVKSKVENRSAKANLNSMKTKFLTSKKKFASIQPECGVEQDFMIIMKNNLQRADVSNPSPTAGKYMVYTKGNIREKLLGQGIKFDTASMYMLDNDKNFEEEIIDVEEAYDNVEEVEKDDGKLSKDDRKVSKKVQNKENVEKERFSIYNMKSVARKVFPPGCDIVSSDDEQFFFSSILLFAI